MFKNFGALHVAAAFAFVAAIAGWQYYSQTRSSEPTSSGSVPVVEADASTSAVKVETTEAQAAETVTVDEDAESEQNSVEAAVEVETEANVTEDLAQVENAEAEETEVADVEEAETDAVKEPQVPDSTDQDVAEAEADADAQTEVGNEEEAEVQQAILPLPAFDVVRVETDGTTVVAGTCPAGSLVSIQVDGQDVESGTCDASGQFVLFLDIGKSEQARVMTLSAKQFDTTLLADAQVIIAPVVQQVAAADAEDAVETQSASNSQQTEADVAEVSENEADDVIAATTSESEGSAEETVEVAEATDEEPKAEVSQDGTEENASEAPVPAEQVASVEEGGMESSNEDMSSSDTGAPTETEQSAEIADTEALQAAEEEITDQTAPAVDNAEAETPTEPQSAPAVLLVKDDGVDILQGVGAAPQVMDQLTVAAITYSEKGAVYLSGFSPAGFLRVYLNNTQVIVLEVPEPGEWKAELVDVAPGVYTLRVDQVDADGNVQSRVETPFKREEPEKVVEVAKTRKPLVSLEVVQPGSTLWAISRETYGSGVLFVNIFEANRDQIRDPDLIYPGQIFELPAPPGAKKKKRGSGQ